MRASSPAAATASRLSLRGRILLLSACALVTVFGLGVWTFSVALQAILNRSAESEASAQAAQIAAVIATGEYAPADAVRTLPTRGSVLQLVGPGGQVLASSDQEHGGAAMATAMPAPGAEVSTTIGTSGAEGDPFAVVSHGLPQRAGSAQTLIVATPLDTENRTANTATTLLGAGSIVVGLIVLGLIARAVSSSLRPVRQLSAEVAAIEGTHDAGQVSVPVANDEIRALATTMNGMLDRLARADAATRRFVSDASHELRSPLATLRTHVEVAPALDGHFARVDRELTLGEIDRLSRLVADLLTLAKADDRGLALARDEVDLDDVVDIEIRRLRAIAPGTVRGQILPVQVTGDAERLAQILRNLTDNALRHTTDWVSVTMGVESDQVQVHVDNSGPPVPVAARTAIFDRFARLDGARSRDAGGSGLGLAIAAALASAHGGAVTAGESPTGDCRFTLSLPLRGDGSA